MLIFNDDFHTCHHLIFKRYNKKAASLLGDDMRQKINRDQVEVNPRRSLMEIIFSLVWRSSLMCINNNFVLFECYETNNMPEAMIVFLSNKIIIRRACKQWKRNQ